MSGFKHQKGNKPSVIVDMYQLGNGQESIREICLHYILHNNGKQDAEHQKLDSKLPMLDNSN